MTTCRELIEFLDDYVAGDLTSEQAERFNHHLTRCPSCRAYLESYRTTIAAAKRANAVEIEDVPADLIVSILATVTEKD